MVALVAGVLALSLWTATLAGRQALRQFRISQEELANGTASALRGYLESFDADTRLLAELAEGTRRQSIDRPAQDRVILAGLRALAVVVPHYRTLALFRPDHDALVAIDPSEDQANIAPALVKASAELAREIAAGGRARLKGPLTLAGGRAFYLYGAPVGTGEAVVVTGDVAVMFQLISRTHLDSNRLVVRDPFGAMWLGCEQRKLCRLLPAATADSAALSETIDASTRNDRATPTEPHVAAHGGVERLGLPPRVVVGSAAPIHSPLGDWFVAMIASASDLDMRQRAYLWKLVLTSAGVAVAMASVGIFLVRQHATAAALAARLQSDAELRGLERQLVRAEKLVTVGVLSAGIAHEVGTPLTVIRGLAEHLLDLPLEARVAEDLRRIVNQIDRIASTIGQVLEFSREQPLETGAVDAVAAVETAKELLAWRLEARRIEVTVTPEGAVPPLAAAPQQFEQVVVNLLMNACDASPVGGTVAVTLARAATPRHHVRMQIADRGVGISPQHLDLVLDPYFTTKPRGEGTGLGLAIVAQIVRAHRGRIAFESTVGVGTVVSVLWPSDEEPRHA